MTQYPEMHMDDFGEYTITVYLTQHGGGSGGWTIETAIHREEELIGKKHRNADDSFATYDEARAAGLEEGKQRIRKLPGYKE